MDEASESSTGEASPEATQESGNIESRASSSASSSITTPAATVVAETEPPKKTGGFNNTSSVSPFATVKSGENVFSSAASPFAAVEKTTSVFDSQPTSSAFSGGLDSSSFGGDSTKSVFGADSSTSKNVFGSGSATTKSAFGSDPSTTKSVFGSDSSTAKNVFGSSSSFSTGFGQGSESTAGSVFGTKSVVGSVGNPSQAARENTSVSETLGPLPLESNESPCTSTDFVTNDPLPFKKKSLLLHHNPPALSAALLDQRPVLPKRPAFWVIRRVKVRAKEILERCCLNAKPAMKMISRIRRRTKILELEYLRTQSKSMVNSISIFDSPEKSFGAEEYQTNCRTFHFFTSTLQYIRVKKMR